MKTKTDIVRDEIRSYLKEQGIGVKIRQVDLTKYILEHSVVATEGIIRGIYNACQGIGRSPKTIQHVRFVKEDGKVFYYYDPTSDANFSEDSVMGKIKRITLEFEENLKVSNLLNVSLLDLPFEERKIYLNFIDNYEELRNIFLTKEDFKQ